MYATVLLITTGLFPSHGEEMIVRKLTTEQEQTIRKLVYEENPKITRRNLFDHSGFVEVPNALGQIYAHNPQPVIDLLLTIASGANPDDAHMAICYALSLSVEPPGLSVVCTLMYERDKYDAPDKNWKVSPRQFWITVVKERRKK